MNNCTTRAFEFLEGISPGSYAGLIRYALEHEGIVHSSPDCFCVAIPDEDDPQTVLILFQCSRLSVLWRLAKMYRHQFTYVRFRRDFKNRYPERCVPIERLLGKSSLAERVSGF